MPLDLTFLIWSVALALVQIVIAVLGAMLQVGLPALAGNRESLPAITGWAGRAARAHRNMLENLGLFTALVLAAQLAGRANGTTALGCELFFWGRLAYVPIFLIGIPWARTGAWAVSIAGLLLVFSQLV